MRESIYALGVLSRDRIRDFITIGLVACGVVYMPVAVAGANRWTAIGPDGANVVALAIDPRTPATIFAGTSGSGILKSNDAGMTWVAANAGLTTVNVSALAVDPSRPSTIFAGTEAGVFKSSDGGQSWVPANPGTGGGSNLVVNALAFDSATPATLYAATTFGLFKTSDGAASWTSIKVSESTFSPSPAMRTITIDPATPSTLYVDDLVLGAGYFLFKSTDGGKSWSRIQFIPGDGEGGSTLASVAIDAGPPTRIYIAFFYDGLLASADDGATFSPLDTPPPAIRSLAVDGRLSGTLYAGTSLGEVFRSTDSGNHWTSSLLIRESAWGINVIALTATVPATIYAGFGAGIFSSADGAQTWTHPTLGVRDVAVSMAAFDSSATSTIYAAVNNTLMKTTDGGAHWYDVGPPLNWVSSLIIDPAAPSIVYVAGGYFAGSSSLNKSTDGGAHWSTVLTGQTVIQAAAIAPSRSTTLYVGQALVGALKSVDGGASWTLVNNGLTAVGPYITALAVDPTNADVVYAATPPAGSPSSDGKIFKSTNGAAEWKMVLSGPMYISSIAVDRNSPATVYATSVDGGVLKSADAGQTWSVGFLPTFGAQALAIGPSAQIYAASDDGVFDSMDGITWSSFNTGLPNSWGSSIAIDPAGSLLRAATTAGLFELAISPPQPSRTLALIEYFHPGFNQYFVASTADEIIKLNNGTLSGWRRTGLYFNGYPAAVAGAQAVCRFESTAFAQKSSHFYTPFAAECAVVAANANWKLESNAAFYADVPAGDGTCPKDFVPVYRLYNNGQGGAPNHRFTSHPGFRAQMIAQGWLPEGAGPNGVEMCSPR